MWNVPLSTISTISTNQAAVPVWTDSFSNSNDQHQPANQPSKISYWYWWCRLFGFSFPACRLNFPFLSLFPTWWDLPPAATSPATGQAWFAFSRYLMYLMYSTHLMYSFCEQSQFSVQYLNTKTFKWSVVQTLTNIIQQWYWLPFTRMQQRVCKALQLWQWWEKRECHLILDFQTFISPIQGFSCFHSFLLFFCRIDWGFVWRLIISKFWYAANQFFFFLFQSFE